jgi:ATP-dependent DNA ligase
MLLLRMVILPEGPAWLYELKLHGFRAIAFKVAGTVYLRARQ